MNNAFLSFFQFFFNARCLWLSSSTFSAEVYTYLQWFHKDLMSQTKLSFVYFIDCSSSHWDKEGICLEYVLSYSNKALIPLCSKVMGSIESKTIHMRRKLFSWIATFVYLYYYDFFPSHFFYFSTLHQTQWKSPLFILVYRNILRDI